jgi:hypothetical protein
MPEEENSLVSLGGFGGHIVLKFENACENDPANPYGIDFTVFGNAFSGSSEVGVVWVMKDENENGLPDDTWYEIAGSHYYFSETQHDYQLTYYKTDTRDIKWKDNLGASGLLKANSYNMQEYYPTAEYFPDYPSDSVTFNGTLLPAVVDASNPMEIKLKVLDFGYADNHAKLQGVPLTVPDNPYTLATEGAGGDAIDISWAVDAVGNYVDLDAIHFVKIVTGYFASLGRLGEASTDVSYVVDTEPNEALTGKENLIVLYQFPEKLLVGDSLQLEGRYFSKGRPVETEMSYSTVSKQQIEINSNGKVKALKTGEATIQVAALDEIKQLTFQVVEPDSIQFISDFTSVYPGDTVLLEANIFDNLGELFSTNISFSSLSSEFGKIIQQIDKWYFVAENPGQVTIKCTVPGFTIEKSITFQVYSERDKINIYFTLKTEEENLLPFQWIEVGQADINSFVENRAGDYSSSERPLLSHALLAGLQKAAVNFSFRDDEISTGKLYLYEVENDGLFSHGWGGMSEPQAYAQAWIARLNHQQFINDFDNISITNGDTVALYHISNIADPWVFTLLTADKDSVKSDEEVEVFYQQTECNYQNGSVTETGFTPVVNREVSAGGNYFTGEDGKVTFHVETAPIIISSGNDAVLIESKILTGNNFFHTSDIHIFPNPAKDQLIISGENLGGSVLYIFNEMGRLLFQEIAQSNRCIWNVQKYIPGVYFVKVINEEGVITQKIVKR